MRGGGDAVLPKHHLFEKRAENTNDGYGHVAGYMYNALACESSVIVRCEVGSGRLKYVGLWEMHTTVTGPTQLRHISMKLGHRSVFVALGL